MMVELRTKILLYLFLALFVLSALSIYFRATVLQDYEVYWFNYDEEEEVEANLDV